MLKHISIARSRIVLSIDVYFILQNIIDQMSESETGQVQVQ